MNLRSRLNTVERLAREGCYLTGEAPCPSCGGPYPLRDRSVVVNSGKGEVLQHCPTCDRPVDARGRDIGESGGVIFLDTRRVEVPMPGAPGDQFAGER